MTLQLLPFGPDISHGVGEGVHTWHTSVCGYAQILHITMATRERGNGTSAREDTPLCSILIASGFCIAELSDYGDFFLGNSSVYPIPLSLDLFVLIW